MNSRLTFHFSDVIYVEDNPDEMDEMKKIANKKKDDNHWRKFRNILLKHKAYKFEEEYRVLIMLPEGNND